jgi:hypothetical protein
MSARLAAFSASESNRMSSDEVAGLLERVPGQPGLRAQTMPPLVVPPAAAVSRQWQSERQADTAPPPAPAGTPQVHWYAPQREAIRLLRAALQGTQHKAHRGQGGILQGATS